MAKKAQAQAAAAAAASAAIDPAESATTQVNIAEFTRTRDSVIVALATLQSSVQELSRAYINHANTVLAPGRGSALDPHLTNILTESGLLAGAPANALAILESVDEGGKKKRKRVPHDPNAPKRALTPYFLYMQHARAQIHKELGESARPKEVADEGTRRWGEMTPAEKSIWDDKYQKNLAAYRVRMQAYKAGEPVPTEEEAARLVEAGKVPTDVAVDADSEEEAAVAAVVVAPVESSDDETPEPVKEPTPKKRRKSDKVAAVEPVKETPKAKKEKKAKKEEEPAPAAKTASEKKKKTRKG